MRSRKLTFSFRKIKTEEMRVYHVKTTSYNFSPIAIQEFNYSDYLEMYREKKYSKILGVGWGQVSTVPPPKKKIY